MTHHLETPVLRHASLKPAYSCITAIRTYFSSLRSPILDHELIIVGDRIFTDVVMANRIRMQCDRRKLKLLASSSASEDTSLAAEKESLLSDYSAGPLAIWTTGVWERESMFMRWMETRLVSAVERWSTPPEGEPLNVRRFIKELPKPEPSKKPGVLEELISRLKGA